MTKKEKILLIAEALEETYPDAVCSLTYTHPYELMIAEGFLHSVPTQESTL